MSNLSTFIRNPNQNNPGLLIGKLLFLLFPVILTQVSCDWFERQDHDITNPKIPTYTVYGHIRKVSNGEAATHLELLLIQGQSYDGGRTDQLITYTDKDGYFEFNGVPRGSYRLLVYLTDEDYIQVEFGVINYADYELNVTIPL